jgi:hypothetical protein
MKKRNTGKSGVLLIEGRSLYETGYNTIFETPRVSEYNIELTMALVNSIEPKKLKHNLAKYYRLQMAHLQDHGKMPFMFIDNMPKVEANWAQAGYPSQVWMFAKIESLSFTYFRRLYRAIHPHTGKPVWIAGRTLGMSEEEFIIESNYRMLFGE